MPTKEQTYLIALGGNMPSELGGPELTLRAALQRLAQAGVQIEAVSRFFQTPCFPEGAGPDYVNAAAKLHTQLAPKALLTLLHEIEAAFGRERVQRWGMRSLDLDIIAADNRILPDVDTYHLWQSLPPEIQRIEAPTQLVLPHPRLAERAFVLIPWAEIAPDWLHPVTGQSVTAMLNALPEGEKEAVIPL